MLYLTLWLCTAGRHHSVGFPEEGITCSAVAA